MDKSQFRIYRNLLYDRLVSILQILQRIVHQSVMVFEQTKYGFFGFERRFLKVKLSLSLIGQNEQNHGTNPQEMC